MGDIAVEWDGMMGEMFNDSCVATSNVRGIGRGALRITDAALFVPNVESAGGEDRLPVWMAFRVLSALKRDIGERIVEGAPALAVAADERALAQNLEASMNAMLQPTGASFHVASVHVVIDEETRAWLMQSQAPTAAPMVTAPAPSAIAPGSHVLATWTNGQTYGASVRGFDGTNYEIAWDGGSAVAWVPASAVRRA